MLEMTQSTRSTIGLPPVGFGTYQLSAEQAEYCVAEALKAGFRHIDSAEGYNNEEGTGKALEAAGVPRDEIFVTIKLFPGYARWGTSEKTRAQTIATLKKQLQRLRLDHVDLCLIHAPLRRSDWNSGRPWWN